MSEYKSLELLANSPSLDQLTTKASELKKLVVDQEEFADLKRKVTSPTEPEVKDSATLLGLYKAEIPAENFITAGDKAWTDPECKILDQMREIENKFKDAWGLD